MRIRFFSFLSLSLSQHGIRAKGIYQGANLPQRLARCQPNLLARVQAPRRKSWGIFESLTALILIWPTKLSCRDAPIHDISACFPPYFNQVYDFLNITIQILRRLSKAFHSSKGLYKTKHHYLDMHGFTIMYPLAGYDVLENIFHWNIYIKLLRR